MPNLDGIIPILPSSGTYSNRTSTKNGQEYNIFPFDPKAANSSIFNQTGQLGQYNTPGYLYGYGDPNDPAAAAKYQFSTRIDPYMLPDKITPSQLTNTAAQSVGPAQFSVNGTTTTQGVGTNQTSSPFTATAPATAQTTQAMPQGQQGFNFGGQFMPGSFGNSTAGQNTPFYQQQPASQVQDQSGLGVLTPWNKGLGKQGASTMPVNPQIQALLQSR